MLFDGLYWPIRMVVVLILGPIWQVRVLLHLHVVPISTVDEQAMPTATAPVVRV